MIILGSNYRASGPPVHLPYTEASADANTFVCEFTGGAAANETGVGGGLAGADLVLTQAGSVAASSAGWRTIDATDDRFTVTQTLLDTLLKGTEWSIIHHVRNWNTPAERGVWQFNQATTIILMSVSSSFAYASGGSNKAALNHGGFTEPYATNPTNLSVMPTAHSTTAETMVAVWYKNAILHFGWVASSNVPTGWDSFPSAQRIALPMVGDWSAASFTGSKFIVGSASGGGFDISRVIVSKLGLAAAYL